MSNLIEQILKHKTTPFICLGFAFVLFFSANRSLFAAIFDQGSDTTQSVSLKSVDLAKKYNEHFVKVIQCRIKVQTATVDEKLACAKSAWALGLVGQAREIWNEVLKDPRVDGIEKYRSQLSAAILEIQEQDYEKARLLAEDVLAEIYSSNLKAQYLILIAQSWAIEEKAEKAIHYYRQAFESGDELVRSEAKFMLAEQEFKIGKIDDARIDFMAVDSASEYALPALLRLAKIDFENGNYESALIWKKEITDNHFVKDELSWLRYIAVESFVHSNQLEEARKELTILSAEVSSQDTWYNLAVAAVESGIVRNDL